MIAILTPFVKTLGVKERAKKPRARESAGPWGEAYALDAFRAMGCSTK